MANQQAVLNQLMDFQNFGIQVNVTPPIPFPILANVWQWNTRTGMPIFEDVNQPWSRFLPDSLTNCPFAATPIGQIFVTGMQGNVPDFEVDLDANGGKRANATGSLIAMIYKGDLKKMEVNRQGRFLTVTKNNAQLHPYDNIYGHIAIRTTNMPFNRQYRSPQDLIDDINLKGARGFYGPQSMWCRYPNCIVTGPLVTSTPTVQWGQAPHQVIHLRKCFSCSSTNVVYLLHCQACLNLGLWSTYIGERQSEERNLHNRISNHVTQIQDEQLRNLYPNPAALPGIVAQMLAGAIPDPHFLLQDPYVHFNFVHRPQNRRYTFLEGNFPSTLSRKRCEYQYKLLCGNFVYNPATNSGSLNKLY